MFRQKLSWILAIICIFAITACQQEDPLQPEDNTPVNTSTETVDNETPIIITPEATFAALRKTFKNPMLKDFQKLKEITQNEHYLAFLAQEYPTQEPFHNFDKFIQAIGPPRERYLPFLKNIIENPTDDDFDIFHYIIEEFRATEVLLYLALSKPGNLIKIVEAIEKQGAAFENREVQQWLELHIQDPRRQDFILSLRNFITELQKEDATRIQQLFNEYGENNGTIWLAILHPTLTAYIINNFTDIQVFIDWVEGNLFFDPVELRPEMLDRFQE